MSVEGHLIEFSSAAVRVHRAAKQTAKETKKAKAVVKPTEKDNTKEGSK